jgi:hypothetical protein
VARPGHEFSSPVHFVIHRALNTFSWAGLKRQRHLDGGNDTQNRYKSSPAIIYQKKIKENEISCPGGHERE